MTIVGFDDRNHLSLNVLGRCIFQTDSSLAVSWAETAALRDDSLHLRDEVLQLVVCLFLPFSSSFFAMVSPVSPNQLTFGGLPRNSSSLLQATFPS